MATFAHCVSTLDYDDLKLLHDVVASLEHMSIISKHIERQFKICKEIYSIAEGLLSSRTTGRHAQQQVQLDALILPLQGQIPVLGPCHDTDQLLNLFLNGNSNDWDNIMIDHMRLSLDY